MPAWKCVQHQFAITVAQGKQCPMCGADPPSVTAPTLTVKKPETKGPQALPTATLLVPLVHPSIEPVEPTRPILLLFNSKGGRGAAAALAIPENLLFEIGEADIATDQDLAERLKQATTFSTWNKKVVVYGHSNYAGQFISDNSRNRTGTEMGEFIEARIYRHIDPVTEANITVLACYIGNQSNTENRFLDEMAQVFRAVNRPYHLKGSRRMVSIDRQTLADGRKAVTQIKFLGTLHEQHRKEWPSKNKYDDVPRQHTHYTKRPAGSMEDFAKKYPIVYKARQLDKRAVFRYVSSRADPTAE